MIHSLSTTYQNPQSYYLEPLSPDLDLEENTSKASQNVFTGFAGQRREDQNHRCLSPKSVKILTSIGKICAGAVLGAASGAGVGALSTLITGKDLKKSVELGAIVVGVLLTVLMGAFELKGVIEEH